MDGGKESSYFSPRRGGEIAFSRFIRMGFDILLAYHFSYRKKGRGSSPLLPSIKEGKKKALISADCEKEKKRPKDLRCRPEREGKKTSLWYPT